MKKCNKCGEEKPLTEFHKDKAKKDGHRGYCKECATVNAKRHYYANPEKAKANVRARYQAKRREILDGKREYNSRWSKNNREKCTAQLALYRARKRCATPHWAELDRIQLVYKKAAEYGFSVDHIVPMKSDIVCGLHVWNNLQLLDIPLNTAKLNRHWPDMPEEAL